MFRRMFGQKKEPLPTADDLAQGREFGRGDLVAQRYEVLDVRYGAMGVVYIALDRAINQRVAIKSFQNKFLWNEQALSYFNDEATVWIRLGSHPNIVQAYALHEFAGRPHVVAEYIDGYSLRALGGRCDAQQALDIAIPICWALSYAHERGAIVHRDIKPDNVLVGKNGVPKVTDFGLARALPWYASTPTTGEVPMGRRVSTTFGGTPQYMAPELFRGAFTIGPWVDVYSFGATFFELLTGHLPVDAGAGSWVEAHRRISKPDPCAYRPDLHSGFAYIVGRCLDADPMRRYRSFAELEHDLQMLRRHLFKGPLEQKNASREALADQLRSQGVAHLSLNEPRAALHTFKKATQLRPDQPELWLDYALTAITLWQDEDALEACKRGLGLLPEANLAAQLEQTRGRALARKHYTEEALAAYDRSLKLNRFDAQTHLARGELLASLGAHDEALRCYEAAARYDRLNPRAWQLLSAAQLAADQTRPALESIDNALRIDPRNGASWRQRGACLQRLRRTREAGEAFTMALKIDPDDDEAQAGMRGLQQAQRR